MQSRSRVQSRNPSRAASPALSHRSRRSMVSSRQRQKYMDDLTDDEDSELEMFTDDSRSRIKKSMEALRNSRHRKNSEQLDLDYRDNEVINRIQRMKEKSKLIRERRSGSLTNWPTTTKERESGSLTPSDDELRRLSTKFRKSSLTSPLLEKNKKILSDSASERDDKKKKSGSRNALEESTSKQHQVVRDSSPKVTKIDHQNKVEELSIAISETRQHTSLPTSKHPSEVKNIEVTSTKSEELRVNRAWEHQQEPQTSSSAMRNVSRQEITRLSSPATTALEKESAQIPAETLTIKPSIQATTSTSPPSSPENWECEHCTFVNECDVKICVICCKTRVEVLKQMPSPAEDEEIDINEINDSILKSENDAKQKGKLKKITFIKGTKAR